MNQDVEGPSGEHAHLAADHLRPGLSQQRIRDGSRRVHEYRGLGRLDATRLGGLSFARSMMPPSFTRIVLRSFPTACFLGLLLAQGCSSAEWVNINNPKADYASDFNKCEMEAYNNPKFQGGMKLYVEEYRDRCLAKLGWRLREKRD